jgi:tetratricopeptide (TPR) repeat protein
MKQLLLIGLLTVAFGGSARAIDYPSLAAVKRLRAENRPDEALQKLEALAAATDDPAENFTYVSQAVDIAVDTLKNADRALALAATIKDRQLQDFAHLRVLADFQRYDEALTFTSDKSIDQWPVRVRGQAHGILAGIYHAKKDDAAELAEWQRAAASPGAEVAVRGRALCESGMLLLKQGDAVSAEVQFRQALAVTPANYAWRVDGLIALSQILVKQQRAKEAVQAFDGVDYAKVTSVVARGNLLEAYARALLAAGKKIRAIETFDRLLTLDLPAAWKTRINNELDRMAEEF